MAEENDNNEDDMIEGAAKDIWDGDDNQGGDVPPPDLSLVDLDQPGREDLEDNDAEAEDDADFDPVASLEREVAELKDKLLRTMADSENTRRIASREKDNASKYAIANFAREMLTVADNMSRALESIPEEARKESETMETFYVGVDMTCRDMLAAFERVGIQPIEALGKAFDPALHEAMFEAPDESVVEGTVVQVLRTGYVLGDRLLRPSQVGIAKGGPKGAAKAPAEASANAKGGTEGPDVQEAYEAGKGPKGGQFDQKT